MEKNSIVYLEEDIDVPIKNCVKYLNLLGIETLWSCCGFDYEGQEDKDHITGCLQFICKPTQHAFELFQKLLELPDMNLFKVTLEKQQSLPIFLNLGIRGVNVWGHPKSPHFHEAFVVCIAVLEKALLMLQDEFKKEVVLIDTNIVMKEKYASWQHGSAKPWRIARDQETSEHEIQKIQ